MRIRQRPTDERHPKNDGGSDCGPGGGSLSEARQRGKDLLSAGDNVISQALSKNSEAFLSQSKQEGGE